MPHQFRLTGSAIFEEDGGYALLSALSRPFPFLHGKEHVQIAPLTGTRLKGSKIRIANKSFLHIRGITDSEAAEMQNKVFSLDEQEITIGGAVQIEILPSQNLVSRLVVFNDAVNFSDFCLTLARRIPNTASFQVTRSRSFRIKNRLHLGYAVKLSDLSPDDSVRIQSEGIGKFTSMGCGVFRAVEKIL